MDCEAKDTPLIFLLVLSGCLGALVAGGLVVFCCNKRCRPKKTKPVHNFHEVEANISPVSQGVNRQESHEELYVETYEGSQLKELRERRERRERDSGLQKGKEHGYRSAREGSGTDYDSVISYKSRQLSVVSGVHHDDNMERNMSTSSSSSSSSSASSVPGVKQAPVHLHIAEPEHVQHVRSPVVLPPSSCSSSDEEADVEVVHMEIIPGHISSSSSSSSSSEEEVEETATTEKMQSISSESEEDMIIAEYTGTVESTEQALAAVEMEMEDVKTGVQPSATESSLSLRRSSTSSSSSSSSSNSPSKTIAEVDLSIPFSQQIVSELESGDFRYSANYFTHITSDLQGRNSGHIYGIQEEEEEGSSIGSYSSVGEPMKEEGRRSSSGRGTGSSIEDPNSSSYRLKMMTSIVEDARRRSGGETYNRHVQETQA